ncbi:hypothetical protein Tco_0538259 [Tanacetum coccineum]
MPIILSRSGSIRFGSFLPSVMLWLVIIVVVVGVGVTVVVVVTETMAMMRMSRPMMMRMMMLILRGDEEEKEHPAPADSIAVALPAVDHALSAKETEPFETDESAATPPPHHVARILAIRIPPPSPLSLWSSSLPQIPSPPLPLAPPPLPVSPTYPLGYRATMIQMRAEAPSTSLSLPPHIILSHTRAYTPPSGTSPSGTPPLLPIPLSTLSPPLHLPSTDHRTDRPEVCLPPRKRLCIALGPRYDVEESSSAAAARLTGGFRQTWFCCHYGQKMAPKRATRLNIALETTNTTSVTKALLPLWQHVMLTEIQMAMIAIFGNGRRMFPEEFNKIEKYVGGFPDMIHGSVVVSKPKTMQEAVEIVTELMDKKILTFAERQTESQRKQDDNQQQKQQQNKRQNTGKAYTTGAGEKKQYGGLNPYA